jgi:hypothetical protein
VVLHQNTNGYLGVKVTCGNNFKKVNHIHCKIIAFKVNERVVFTPSPCGGTLYEHALIHTKP